MNKQWGVLGWEGGSGVASHKGCCCLFFSYYTLSHFPYLVLPHCPRPFPFVLPVAAALYISKLAVLLWLLLSFAHKRYPLYLHIFKFMLFPYPSSLYSGGSDVVRIPWNLLSSSLCVSLVLTGVYIYIYIWLSLWASLFPLLKRKTKQKLNENNTFIFIYYLAFHCWCCTLFPSAHSSGKGVPTKSAVAIPAWDMGACSLTQYHRNYRNGRNQKNK